MVLPLETGTTLTGVQNRVGEHGVSQCCWTRCFHGAWRIAPGEILTGVFGLIGLPCGLATCQKGCWTSSAGAFMADCRFVKKATMEIILPNFGSKLIPLAHIGHRLAPYWPSTVYKSRYDKVQKNARCNATHLGKLRGCVIFVAKVEKL